MIKLIQKIIRDVLQTSLHWKIFRKNSGKNIQNLKSDWVRNVSLHKSFFVRDHYPPIASWMCEIEIRIYCHSEVLICCDVLFFLFLALRRSIQGRSHYGVQGGGTWHPPLQFPNQKKPNSSIFKHHGYYFLWVFRIIRAKNFYRAYYNFWIIYGGVSLFLIT